MRRLTRYKRTAIAGGVAVVSVSASTHTADGAGPAAFPYPPICTNHQPDRLGYNFWNWGPGGFWTAADKLEVEQGINRWSRATGSTVAPVVAIGENFGVNPIPVIRGTPTPVGHEQQAGQSDAAWNGAHDHDGDGRNDHVTQANCGIMQISSPLGANWIEHSAAHEFGHSLGLGHSGRADTRQQPGGRLTGFFGAGGDGVTPLMNGNCAGAPQATEYPNGDDWAALNTQKTGRLTAEVGFESLLLDDTVWKGNYLNETALPAVGARYVSVPPGATISQRVRVEQDPADSFQVSARYKSNSSAGMSFKLKGRVTSRANGGLPCGDPFYPAGGAWTQIWAATWIDPNGGASWQSGTSLYGQGTTVFWPVIDPTNYELELLAWNGAPAAPGDALYIDEFKVTG